MNKFIDLIFNFSFSLLGIFLIFFWVFDFLCNFWRFWIFFRIFFVAKAENWIYHCNCNCCIFSADLRFYETCARFAVIRGGDLWLRLKKLYLFKLLWFFNDCFWTLSGKFGEDSCAHIYLGNLSAQSFLKRITWNRKSDFFFCSRIKSKVSYSSKHIFQLILMSLA